MALAVAFAASAQTPAPKTAPAATPKATKAAPKPKVAACNSFKEEAACRGEGERCQWVSAAMGKDKAGKEVVKKKAFCRTTPAVAKKKAAAPKAPAKAKAPAASTAPATK
jgi:hypothetical protein